MARFAEKYEVSHGSNTSSTVGSNEPSVSIDSSSMVGYVKRVDHKRCMALVDVPAKDDDIPMTYSPEIGIREGAVVAITIASSVPVITKVISFGTENIGILDPLGMDKKGEFFSVKQPKAYGRYEEACGASSNIFHEDGEKVFASDFSGFKAGIDHSVMFYEANSRFVCSDKIAGIFANNVLLFSEAGSVVMDEPEDGEDMGVKTESIHRIEGTGNGRTGVEVFKEYKGNVSSGLRTDMIEIGKLPGSNINIEELIYAMLVIDDNIDDYKQTTEEVSHTYINRKLSVQSSSSDVCINTVLQGEGLGLKTDDLEYRAIIAKCDGIDIAITYMKGVTKQGDVYEFSAGEACYVHNEVKNISIQDRRDFMLADYSEIYQRNKKSVQFPISESSNIYYENFGNNIQEIKGISYHHYYKHANFGFINTSTEYEVDVPSGISTQEFKISPVIALETNNYSTRAKKHEGIDRDVLISEQLNDSGSSVIVTKSAGGSARHDISVKDKQKAAVIGIGDGLISATSPDNIILKSKQFTSDSDLNYFTGETSMGDRLMVKGDFFLDASNIYLTAKDYIVLSGNNLFTYLTGSAYTTYSGDYVVHSSEVGIDANGKPKYSSLLWMSDFEIFMQSESTQIYGDKYMYAFSSEYAGFGGKDAVFFGGSI